MATPNVVVSYGSIMDAFNQGKQTVNDAIAHGARMAAANVVEQTLLQTILSKALAAMESAEKHPGIMTAPCDVYASLLQTHIAKHAAEEGKLVPMIDANGQEYFVTKFDDNDLAGWIGSFFGWVRGIKKHRWLAPPTAPEPFGNTTQAALLGDWGTNLYGAPFCGDSIKAEGDKYKLLIHLGDVYYSGDPEEEHSRFLDVWPDNSGATSRALNSNHEMYAGGYGYFDETLPKFGQTSSCVALQNDNWLVVGLDTGYRETIFNLWHGGIESNQVDWLDAMIAQAGGRKVVLMSHHQPFTLLDKSLDNNTVGKLGKILTDKKIFAWYFGHEHRCVIYEQHPLHGYYGRCVGHSGYPYFRIDLGNAPTDTSFPEFRTIPEKLGLPGGLVLDGPNRYAPKGHEDEFGSQGYMKLLFDGGLLHEQVLLPDGTVIYDKTLT